MSIYKTLKDNFFVIAGPCVIEDYSTLSEIADFLKNLSVELNFPLIFKASYEKANRTSIESYTGPGLEKGLQYLKKIKEDFNLPILTDIHLPYQAELVAEVADIIQIPAFLSRQTELITQAAKTDKIINVKKGQFLAPEDMKNVAGKILSRNNNKILFTERGTSFGYHNLVVDFRSFAIMKKIGYPVVYDVTHSLQQPSLGKTSGGTPQYAPMMAKAAIATGCVNGLFIETHPNPTLAKSDAKSMLKLSELPELIKKCKKIYEENYEKSV